MTCRGQRALRGWLTALASLLKQTQNSGGWGCVPKYSLSAAGGGWGVNYMLACARKCRETFREEGEERGIWGGGVVYVSSPLSSPSCYSGCSLSRRYATWSSPGSPPAGRAWPPCSCAYVHANGGGWGVGDLKCCDKERRFQEISPSDRFWFTTNESTCRKDGEILHIMNHSNSLINSP